MKRIERCGESYYPIEEIGNFIQICKKENRSILSLEFFQFLEGKVTPYSKLQAIDSASLYDETKSNAENASTCNNFISSCIDKKDLKNLKGLYFIAIVEA